MPISVGIVFGLESIPDILSMELEPELPVELLDPVVVIPGISGMSFMEVMADI